MNKLAGRTVLITGGAKRLGRATALTLAGQGINTIIHYNDSSREADETVRLSINKGVLSAKIQYDFNNTDGINKLIQEAVKITGNLDFIINSASVYPEDTLESISGKRLDRKSTRLNSSHIPLSRMPSSA